MPTSTKRPRYAFPNIARVQLNAFSLYSLEPNVSLILAKGVTCLAGANGIGKSTFLATVNFGLTGAVPNPRRRLLSTGQYLREAQDYTADFFEGRISEEDRDVAAITLDFKVGKVEYSIQRALFAPIELLSLSIKDNGKPRDLGASLTPVQRDAVYRTNLCGDIGMQSFEQFVFFQHFLLTFDEARHLLFWDEAASTQMLYLCFGGDPSEAAKADELNREMERAGSWGRNLQFQASNLGKRISILEASTGGNESPEGVEQATTIYQERTSALESASASVNEAEQRLAESDLRVAQANASVSALRITYSDAFNSLLHDASSPKNHPIIKEALQGSTCPICHTANPQVAARISEKLARHLCPLCESPIEDNRGISEAARSALAEIDGRLSVARDSLNDASAARNRYAEELKSKQQSLLDARTRINEFEQSNNDLLEAIKVRVAAASGPLQQNLSALQQAREQLIIQRDEAYAERDDYKERLRVLQVALQGRYAKAEKEFVPAFRKLAEMFLGIDLDVRLTSSQGTAMKLQIEMRGKSRQQQHQLSESQRFFVDIALRMAIAEYASASSSKAGIFIDTPEGSLDISYEDRAGLMFAEFAVGGHSLLMTANINTSKLLTSMASICGEKMMRLVPMTGWSELSDVQRKATHLFKGAYDEISKALAAGGHVAES
jgi:DNA repair exonuclease SbcCD ATPase subunit